MKQCAARVVSAGAVRSAVWMESVVLCSSVSESRMAAPVHLDGGASTAARPVRPVITAPTVNRSVSVNRVNAIASEDVCVKAGTELAVRNQT